MGFLLEYLDVIIGIVLTYLLTAIGYGWKERSARKKEKRDRDRKYLDEYSEVLADYENFYKTYFDHVVVSGLDDLYSTDHKSNYKEAALILKRMVVLRTKATILEDLPFDTYNLIPMTAILKAKEVDGSHALELYKEAIDTIDNQLRELRSQVKETYKKLD